MSDPGFSGFPSIAFTFFARLAKNNRREWFLAHKDEFEQACQGPLKALTQALDPPFGATRITRIYRDLRFSKDKSPYRTHISTIVKGCYLGLSAEGLYVGTGLYMPEAAVLRRFREAIADDASGKTLATAISALRKKGYEVDTHERLASVPRGYRPEHPRAELLRMKDIHAGKTLPPSQLSTAKAVERVSRVCTDVAPVQRWLQRHVGKVGA
jgi:uncharacterized protein (TIGR02453 family)